nr:immunoglobulin light chain junction region [Macaca mulatta]MOX78403.1 immunoglobulin light chain junction region [Macaca mulatta]MOX78726.1 immunoglobulin light chain junction region [Macaca mulatta]MOX78822.1 immunoglobulin light chain junction region [Macaca mulatta]MOX79032.1 immunoglobulin light chain junction region [Macaca mulatta]
DYYCAIWHSSADAFF